MSTNNNRLKQTVVEILRVSAFNTAEMMHLTSMFSRCEEEIIEELGENAEYFRISLPDGTMIELREKGVQGVTPFYRFRYGILYSGHCFDWKKGRKIFDENIKRLIEAL